MKTIPLSCLILLLFTGCCENAQDELPQSQAPAAKSRPTETVKRFLEAGKKGRKAFLEEGAACMTEKAVKCFIQLASEAVEAGTRRPWVLSYVLGEETVKGGTAVVKALVISTSSLEKQVEYEETYFLRMEKGEWKIHTIGRGLLKLEFEDEGFLKFLEGDLEGWVKDMEGREESDQPEDESDEFHPSRDFMNLPLFDKERCLGITVDELPVHGVRYRRTALWEKKDGGGCSVLLEGWKRKDGEFQSLTLLFHRKESPDRAVVAGVTVQQEEITGEMRALILDSIAEASRDAFNLARKRSRRRGKKTSKPLQPLLETPGKFRIGQLSFEALENFAGIPAGKTKIHPGRFKIEIPSLGLTLTLDQGRLVSYVIQLRGGKGIYPKALSGGIDSTSTPARVRYVWGDAAETQEDLEEGYVMLRYVTEFSDVCYHFEGTDEELEQLEDLAGEDEKIEEFLTHNPPRLKEVSVD